MNRHLTAKEMLKLVSELEEKLDRSPDADLEGAEPADISDLINRTMGLIGSLAFMVGNMQIENPVPRKTSASATVQRG